MYSENPMKNVVSKILVVAVALALLPGPAFSAEAEQGDDSWQFGATIFGWFPDISGQTTSGGSGQVDIEDILENLEFTMMGTLEVHKGRWGIFTDAIYMDVEGSKQGPAATDKLDLASWIWDLVGSYRVLDKPGLVMDALAGARYLDVEQTLTRTPPGTSATAGISNIDGIVGVRGRFAFGSEEALYVPYELDVGMGDSDLTYQAVAGLGYSFGWWELSAVWRYLYYDFSSDIGINDMNFSGPAMGVTFRW